MKKFHEYCNSKKVRLLRDSCVLSIKEIVHNQEDITYDEFRKLLVLASCGGLKQRLSQTNFIQLMKHLLLYSNQELKERNIHSDSLINEDGNKRGRHR